MGLSLLELMLAFAILVVAILSVSSLISFGHRGTQKDFRVVQAVQLLEERMNQILLQKASDLLAAITVGGTTQQTFTTPLLSVPLGPKNVGAATFTVTATLNRQPVVFSTSQLDIESSTNYDKDDPGTWCFSSASSLNGTYDGVSLPFRVVKIIVTVAWTELLNNVPRKVEAVSFAVDYNQ